MYAEFIDVEEGSSSSKPKANEKVPKVEGVKKLNATYIATESEINVRPHNSTKYSSIGSLDKGDKVTVTGRIGDWLQIKYDGGEAYVFAEFFKEESSEEPTEKPKKKPSEKPDKKPVETKPEVKKKIVLDSDINGRYMPTFYSGNKAKLNKGKEVKIDISRGKWTKLIVDNEYYWVIADKLKTKEVEVK